MFKVYEYKIDLVADAFWNLRYRDRTVLLMCRDGNGKFLLGEKANYYPDGILRLLGGGVNGEENPMTAAIREIKEELNIVAGENELVELAEVRIEGIFREKNYKHTVFIYYLNSLKDDFIAGDDVSNIARMSEAELMNLIKRFKQLKGDNIYTDETENFSWGDYGKVYGFIHQVALDEVLNRGF